MLMSYVHTYDMQKEKKNKGNTTCPRLDRSQADFSNIYTW
jgi:hypothetical protein